MRLTQLEIKGFKSFADKTVINFNDCITGIVGPNGCGKSNIVDAVRWVLGEQKTSMLRSEKMENIIFNGSKARKPSGLSEVSLTFENTKNVLPTEYNTVTISRILTRDGESEYRLNDVPCRLKDITSLFLDTGISSDSYAIIELGMVNEILNDVDNSRRKLFEQAAGISKYKARKKETLNKLALTDADLARVNDLLFEIEGNLKILEQQAKKTQKFYQLREEYKTLSIELAIFNLSSYKQSFDQLSKQQQEENDKKLALETEIANLESKLEQEKANEITKQQLLASIQKELNNHINNIRQQENEKQISNEKMKYLNERKLTLQNQISSANNNISTINNEVQQLDTEKTKEENLLKETEIQLSILKNQLQTVKDAHAGQKQKLETKQSENQQLEKTIYELEKRAAVNAAQNENWLNEIKFLEKDNTDKQNELNNFSGQFSTLEKSKAEKEIQLSEIINQETTLSHQIENSENEIESLKQKLADESRKLDAKRNEYNLTKSLVDNMEGFPESIKFLKKNSSWGKNPLLLSDIISCKDEYRVAIENLLEPYLNYYVVENIEEAISAVNLLNEAVKGKANFFILNEIPEAVSSSQPAVGNNIVSAISIVTSEGKYRKLCEYLLGNVFIVDDTHGFSSDSLKSQDGKFLISKSGKFVRSKYTLSGGSVGLFDGKKIGRVKNLETLMQEIITIENGVSSLSEQIQQLQTSLQQQKNSSQKNKIEEEKNNLQQLNNQFFSLKTKKESIESLITSNISKKKIAEENIQRMKEENTSLTAQLADWKNIHSALVSEIKIQEKNLAGISKELNSSNESFSQKNIHFIQQQNKVNSIVQNQNYKQQQLNDYSTQVLQNAATLDSSEMEIADIQDKLKQIEESLIAFYSDKKQIEDSVANAEKEYYSTKNIINELDSKIRTSAKSKEQIDILLNEIRDKNNNLKLELTSLKERLAIEFRVDIDTIIDKEKSGEFNFEELQQKVERLKNRLDNYGEINPMAVEAFTEMQQRFDFITNQKNDLVNAKTSLLQTISEIEVTATDHFLQAFNKVRTHFSQLFRNLFEEQDECDLILVDPNSPLESPLEIIAKPKGKKPLTINQLSGGEQTLTAIALLFSLYLLKPAPFCIFDEVDAPLDDVNIDKFNKIIKQFSKESQFVIVTHNKQTMSAVDIIYGVTMADEGVSKVVPVDFRSLN